VSECINRQITSEYLRVSPSISEIRRSRKFIVTALSFHLQMQQPSHYHTRSNVSHRAGQIVHCRVGCEVRNEGPAAGVDDRTSLCR